MAEEKKQLKIEAELDTSKLKQQAQQGMQAVVNEEKKVESQSRQTSQAVDEIAASGNNVANSLQQAGNQGADALNKIGKSADETAAKIKNIDKSVQGLKIDRLAGIANQLLNSEMAQDIGTAIADETGMSKGVRQIGGGALKGTLGGVATGAAIGSIIPGLGTGVGAAIGGALGLVSGAWSGGKKYFGDKDAEGRAEAERQSRERQARQEELDRRNSLMSDISEGAAEEEFKSYIGKLGGLSKSDLQRVAEGGKQKENEANDAVTKLRDEFTKLFNSGAGSDVLEAKKNEIDNAITVRNKYREFNNATQAEIQNRNREEERQQREELAAKQKKLRGELSDANKEKSGLEKELDSQLNSARNKLSDSLTNIGGGRGYAAQNNGAVQSIDRTLKTKLTSIDERIERITNDLENGATTSEYQ